MKTDHLRLIRPEWGDWDAIRARFKWNVPENFNIAYVACDRHAEADGNRIAIYCENKAGRESQYSFLQLKRLSNRLANVLDGLGVEKGDRVGIILPQRPETVISHMGIYKLGAIALPLSVLFGPEAVGYRLSNSGTKVVITDTEHLELLESMRDRLPNLETIIDCDADSGFWSALDNASDEFEMVNTNSCLLYTSPSPRDRTRSRMPSSA